MSVAKIKKPQVSKKLAGTKAVQSFNKTQSKKLEGALLAQYKTRVDVLKAMAHPTRLFILEVLREGPMCVCDINELVDADVSTISKHLSILRFAGLLSSEKVGLQVFYKLETPCIVNSLSCIEAKVGV